MQFIELKLLLTSGPFSLHRPGRVELDVWLRGADDGYAAAVGAFCAQRRSDGSLVATEPEIPGTALPRLERLARGAGFPGVPKVAGVEDTADLWRCLEVTVGLIDDGVLRTGSLRVEMQASGYTGADRTALASFLAEVLQLLAVESPPVVSVLVGGLGR